MDFYPALAIALSSPPRMWAGSSLETHRTPKCNGNNPLRSSERFSLELLLDALKGRKASSEVTSEWSGLFNFHCR